MDKNGVFKKYDSFIDFYIDGEDYGYGLKRLKQKQKKGIKKRPKAPLETNNNCLIGGRILTLNELDQIINNIKKQK